MNFRFEFPDKFHVNAIFNGNGRKIAEYTVNYVDDGPPLLSKHTGKMANRLMFMNDVSDEWKTLNDHQVFRRIEDEFEQQYSKGGGRKRASTRKKISRKIHTGPKGGKYYIKNGKKVYM